MYFNRAARPILLPVLGVPFFYLTGSIANSMQLLQPLLLAFFSIHLYRIFLLHSAKSFALFATLILSLFPLVLDSALIFLAEFPFLAFATAGLFQIVRPEQSIRSRVLAAFYIGLSLCFRPVEGAFFWTCIFLYGLSEGEWKKSFLLLLGAATIGLIWFYPSHHLLIGWINSGFNDQHGSDSHLTFESILRNGAEVFDRAQLTFTNPGLIFISASFLFWIWRERKISRQQLLAITVGLVPFIIAIFPANRAATVQSRFYLVPVVFCIGFYILKLYRIGPAGFLILALLAKPTLTNLPEKFQDHTQKHEDYKKGRDICLSLLKSIEKYLDKNSEQKILTVHSEWNLQEGPCSVAFYERGYPWILSVTWSEGSSTNQILRSFPVIVVLADDWKEFLVSSRHSPMQKRQIDSILTNKELEKRYFEFSYGGKTQKGTLLSADRIISGQK